MADHEHLEEQVTTALESLATGRVVAPVPPLAKFPSVQRLAEVLLDRGFTEECASTLAAAVCEPGAFRRALESPVTVRVAGGNLVMVFTRLWTPGVVPHPTNTRLSPFAGFPASGQGRRPLPRPTSSDRSPWELHLTIERPEELVDELASAEHLLESENPLADDIAEDGVREPITVVAMTVSHTGDPEMPVGVLSTVDGSSRIAAAHKNLGIDAQAAVYRYARSVRDLRERIGRSLRYHGGDLSPRQVAELNSLTVPALVVVGFDPDDPEQGDFARAIDSRVGNLHVHPPRPWPDGAKADAGFNAVIDALSELYEDDGWVDYYAGNLTPERAEALGYSAYPDVRAGHILADIHHSDHAEAVLAALRSVGARRVTPPELADVAAEAALRSVRGVVRRPEERRARVLLRHLFVLETLQQDWEVGPDRPLEALRDAALEELGADGPRTATAELLAYAAFWMARYQLVRKETQKHLRELDRTDIGDVVERMTMNALGIRTLYQIVKDCRQGELPPRACDEQGEVVLDDDGEAIRVNEEWIRGIWGGLQTALTAHASPQIQLDAARSQFKAAMERAAELLQTLFDPASPDGTPLVETEGVPRKWANEMVERCTDMLGELSRLRTIATRRSTAAESDVSAV